MAKAGTGKDLLSAKERKQSAEEGVVPGAELPGIIFEGLGDDPRPPGTPGPSRSKTLVKLDENSLEKVAKRGTGVPKPTPSGGFSVRLRKSGRMRSGRNMTATVGRSISILNIRALPWRLQIQNHTPPLTIQISCAGHTRLPLQSTA